MPKEMLATPFGPIIELVTNELIDSGIERIIYVTSPGKELIESHLKAVDLHEHPEGKSLSLEFINQNEIPGNGGAILTAVEEKSLTEPFIVVWGDEVFLKNGEKTRSRELLDAYEAIGKPCILLTEVDEKDIPKCGMAVTEASGIHDRLLKITELVEKPAEWPHENRHASVGGYVVDQKMIEYLTKAEKAKDGEVYLAQAIADYIQDGHELFGVLTECEWHETGSMDGYVAAFEALAQRRKQGIL